MNKNTTVNVYRLLFICISLVVLAISSTYAMFTASYEINNPVYIASNLNYTDDLTEVIEVILSPHEIRNINLNITNTDNYNVKYTSWYVSNGYDIDAGTVNSEAFGNLNSGKSVSINVELVNNEEKEVTVVVGVSSANDTFVLNDKMIPLKKQNILMTTASISSDTDLFLNGSLKRNEIASVTFLDNQSYPEDITPVDVSMYNDGTVMMWSDDSNNVYIGGKDGKVNIKDGYELFTFLSTATSINFNNAVETSAMTGMYGMFYGSSKLTNINFGDFNTSNVTNMYAVFYGCAGLTSLDVSSFDTRKTTDISAMFAACSSLTSLDVSNFDTSNVTNMYSLFYACSKLTGLDLSNFDTSKVENMDYMFSLLTFNDLDISNFDTSSVKTMSAMFYKNTGLVSVNLSGFNTSKLENMSYMFRDCPNLISFDFGDIDTSSVLDMGYMFQGCTNLKNVNFGDIDTSSVLDIGFMFRNCTSLINIDLSKFDTSSVTNMQAMFYDCTSLENLDLSNFDTRKVQNMGFMFRGCSSLASVNLSSFNTVEVTNTQTMFYGCSSLTELDLSGFIIDKVTDMSIMFKGCSKLETIYVSDKWKVPSAGDSTNIFVNCTSLVGGAGTHFDASHVDGNYAIVDGGTENPGYLTLKTTTV